ILVLTGTDLVKVLFDALTFRSAHLSSLLKFSHFPRLQCANDIESRLVLKFLKVHQKTPFRNHGAGRFSSSLLINSGMLIGLARTGYYAKRRGNWLNPFWQRDRNARAQG